MKAVIYARYSSHNQREESIEGQIRECRDFAEKNDFIIINEYVDRALSGKTDNRPSFQRLIKDSEKNHFEAVIMYTLDRFARNRYDSAIYKAKLRKNGVRVFYAKQPMPDTPEGIILESVLEGYAEYYSENLSRNIKRGLRENALQGIAAGGSYRCLGYTIGEDKKYQIDPVGAKTVREVFEKYANGMSATQIVKYCNEQGYTTLMGRMFKRSSLETILRNEKYIGTFRYMDVIVPDSIPAIIDKQLFHKVQSMLKHNASAKAKTKARENYLLTTKLFCGHCGASMVGECGTSRSGKTHHYYKCSNRKQKGNCKKATEKKNNLERSIVIYVINHILLDEKINLITNRLMELIEKDFNDTSYITGLQNELSDIQKKLKNITNAIEQGIITTTTKSRLQELESAYSKIERKIAREEIKKPFLTKDQIRYWLSSFKNGDVNDIEFCRKVIDIFVNSVFVYDLDDGDSKNVISFNIPGHNTISIRRSDIAGFAPPNTVNPNQMFYVKNVFGFVFTIKKEDR